jgi:hypothetical protein
MLRLPTLCITDRHIIYICNVLVPIVGCVFVDEMSTDEKGS